MAVTRSGRFAERKARREQWAATRPILLRLVLVVLGIGLAGLALGLMVGGWLGGFLSGASVVLAVTIPVAVIPSITGTVPQMMGASAEREVSRVLRRSVTNRAVSFDGIAMAEWEADHLVLGPGRALAIETKWSAEPWDIAGESIGRVAKAVGQVSTVARRASPLLKAEAGLAVPIDRLVVVCGRRASKAPLLAEVDGCTVVFVTELRAWIGTWCDDLKHEADGAFEDACVRFAEYLERRDAADAAKDRDPWIVRFGVLRPIEFAYEAILAAVASLGATAWLVRAASPRLWVTFGVIAGLGGLGYLGLRRVGWRAAALGWASGSLVLLLIALLLVVRALL